MPQQAGVSTARDPNRADDFVLHTNVTNHGVAESAGQHNNSGGPLPVEMVGFSATVDESSVVLSWRTLSEQDNSGFAVQHRTGGEAFEKIGFREGQGTTSEPTSYRFRVGDLEPGTHAFRLKQVGLDGSASLTDVVRAEIKLDKAFTWTKPAPNPVTSSGTLSMRVRETQDVMIQLHDLLGRRVRTLHDDRLAAGSRHRVTFDASTLAAGTYLVRVDGEFFSDTQKLKVVR